MGSRGCRVIDFDAFRRPASPLFRAYLREQPEALAFYGGGWGEGAVAAAAEAAARPVRAVARALVRQQQARGAVRAAAQAERLAQPGAAAVVTGQQPVLFGGPLFVLYKALGTLALARALEARRGAPVVPVFWVASDDHDFAEIRQTTVLDDQGTLRTVRYEPRREPVGQPAASIVLDEAIEPLLAQLARTLPAGLGRDEVLPLLAACYRPGQSLAGAFARFLSAVLPDLVVLDPSDPELKALAAPVMERELREGSPTSRLAAEAGRRLLAAGFHQQVPVREGFLNLFLLAQGERRPLGLREGAVEVRGTRKTLPLEEALDLMRRDPSAWSPGVLLRPLVQDHLLPTAAYLGGPAEIAYHAQITPSYAHFGLPHPVIFPRPSLTLVEGAQERALEAEGLDLPALQGDPEALLTSWVRKDYPEVEAAFADARAGLSAGLGRVGATLGEVDPTLAGAADAALGRALHQVSALHDKALRALKKRDQARADRLRRTRDALLPGGTLQERGLAFVGVLTRHGLAVSASIGEALDPWARGHQVLPL